MAEFHHKSELLQKPTRIVCPVCHVWWQLGVDQRTLNEHVKSMHPHTWLEWEGWVADQNELTALFALPDFRT
jgi:hypothetical protein